MPDSTVTLDALLGKDIPATVLDLDEDVKTRLAGQIAAARRHQAQLVEDATQTAIRGVPLPVRGVIKKALLG